MMVPGTTHRDDEGDPWQYLRCPSQAMVPSELMPLRVATNRRILLTTNAQLGHSLACGTAETVPDLILLLSRTEFWRALN